MTKFSGIPSGPHFGIITQTSVSIPGDERSRTNPGHGYPASTEYYTVYEAFENETGWKHRIKSLLESRTPFNAIRAIPAKIKTDIVVEIE